MNSQFVNELAIHIKRNCAIFLKEICELKDRSLLYKLFSVDKFLTMNENERVDRLNIEITPHNTIEHLPIKKGLECKQTYYQYVIEIGKLENNPRFIHKMLQEISKKAAIQIFINIIFILQFTNFVIEKVHFFNNQNGTVSLCISYYGYRYYQKDSPAWYISELLTPCAIRILF